MVEKGRGLATSFLLRTLQLKCPQIEMHRITSMTKTSVGDQVDAGDADPSSGGLPLSLPTSFPQILGSPRCGQRRAARPKTMKACGGAALYVGK